MATKTPAGTIQVKHEAYKPAGDNVRAIAGMARCHRCKTVRRVDGWLEKLTNGRDRFGNQRYVTRETWPQLACSCGHHTQGIQRIQGVTTDHTCDARCTSARGHQCECSCGGANHGRDWGL